MVGAFVCCNGLLASVCADDGRLIDALERTHVETSRTTEACNPSASQRPTAMPHRVTSNEHRVVGLFELVSRDVDD
jgi:hypothetical protein